jgi:hypothetical protein
MDSISSESSMQIDKSDYLANPSESMLTSPTLPSSQARFSIPDESIKHMYKRLENLIRPDDDDATIRSYLSLVHYIVDYTLLDDLEFIERLADRDEFVANVEREGEKKVIELLRDTAKRGSWPDLFESRTCSTLLT